MFSCSHFSTTADKTCGSEESHIEAEHVTDNAVSFKTFMLEKCVLSSWSCNHRVPVRLSIHIFLDAQLVKTGQSRSLHIPHIYSPPDYFLCKLEGAPKTSDTFLESENQHAHYMARWSAQRHTVAVGPFINTVCYGCAARFPTAVSET